MSANWLYPEEKQTSHGCVTQSSFAVGSLVPTVGSCLSVEALSPLMLTFQRLGSRVLKKGTPGS